MFIKFENYRATDADADDVFKLDQHEHYCLHVPILFIIPHRWSCWDGIDPITGSINITLESAEMQLPTDPHVEAVVL